MLCPVCKTPLIRIPDLFGDARFRHPNDECKKMSISRLVDTHCIQCGEPFATKKNAAGWHRKTCSDTCKAIVWAINASRLAAKRAAQKQKVRRKLRTMTEVWRPHWQQRAAELDRRWAA